jgi:hypothetical protein
MIWLFSSCCTQGRTNWSSWRSWLWSLHSFLQKIRFLLHQYFSLFFYNTLCMSKEAIFIKIYRANTLISKHSLVSYSKWMMIFKYFKDINFRVFEHPQPRIFNIFGYLLSVVKLYSHLDCNSCLLACTAHIEDFSNWYLISNSLFLLLCQVMLGECPCIEGNPKRLKTFIKFSFAFQTFNLQAAAI